MKLPGAGLVPKVMAVPAGLEGGAIHPDREQDPRASCATSWPLGFRSSSKSGRRGVPDAAPLLTPRRPVSLRT